MPSWIQSRRLRSLAPKARSRKSGILRHVAEEYEARTLASQVLKPGLGGGMDAFLALCCFASGVGHYVNILSSDWEPNDGELGLLLIIRPLLKTSSWLVC